MKLIGIAGRKYAGKDTFAKPLIIDGGGTFNLVKFADGLKNMLRSLFRDAGLDAAMIERMIEGDLKETPTPILGGKTPRWAMQSLGTEWRDMIDRNLWLGITGSRLQKLARGGSRGVIITDTRFPHEVDFIHNLGGVVYRIVGKQRDDNQFSAHPSEAMIDELKVDGEIYNFGTIEDMEVTATVLAEAVGNSNI